MKKLVVTRADEHIRSMTDLTFPIIKYFCNKWDADFMALDHEPPVMSNDKKPHYRIAKVGELLDEYDRIINLDADLVINKNCPNLFEEVPEDCIGTVYEDVGSRKDNRRARIKHAQLAFGDICWEVGYINTGVFVVSRMHAEIFSPIDDKYYWGEGSDDVHIGFQIKRLGFKVHEFSSKFNFMTMFSEDGTSRFDSYILHYAGAGIFDKGIVQSRNEQIALDIEKIYS